MSNLAFVDIETTGLDPLRHEIIEVAIITNDDTFTAKIKPLWKSTIDPDAIKINGYTEKEWRNGYHPSVVAPIISELLNGKMIVGHNPMFDVAFIEELLFRWEEPARFQRRLIDTTVLAHEHLSPCGLKSLSMDSIRTFLYWSKEGSHRALKDAKDCRRLYYTLSRATIFHRIYWKNRRIIYSLLNKLKKINSN